LPKAIACFQQQTYRHSDLMILSDGEDVRDLVPSNDERIRLIHLADSRSIGEKRNFGCERAVGEVICHWDDDDWSAPERIERQVENLHGDSTKAVTGFHSIRFTDGKRWWQYEGTRNYALGTSLCYKHAYWHEHRFRSLNVGEDNHFVAEAHAAGQLVTEDAGDLLYATIHTGNTSPRMLGSNWKRLR
jgi:glycosyltransferase involved in cell wall biosynthesis